MSIDLEKLERFISMIKDNNIKIKEIVTLGKDKFIEDYKNYNTVLRLLQISIEAMIDIGHHIISQKSMGLPKDYVDIFSILKKNNIIDQLEYEKFSNMAKFRNRIVHIYWDVNLEEIYEIIQDNLDDFILFITKINNYLATELTS